MASEIRYTELAAASDRLELNFVRLGVEFGACCMCQMNPRPESPSAEQRSAFVSALGRFADTFERLAAQRIAEAPVAPQSCRSLCTQALSAWDNLFDVRPTEPERYIGFRRSRPGPGIAPNRWCLEIGFRGWLGVGGEDGGNDVTPRIYGLWRSCLLLCGRDAGRRAALELGAAISVWLAVDGAYPLSDEDERRDGNDCERLQDWVRTKVGTMSPVISSDAKLTRLVDESLHSGNPGSLLAALGLIPPTVADGNDTREHSGFDSGEVHTPADGPPPRHSSPTAPTAPLTMAAPAAVESSNSQSGVPSWPTAAPTSPVPVPGDPDPSARGAGVATAIPFDLESSIAAPVWDGTTLTYKGAPIRTLTAKAKKQRALLDALQKARWNDNTDNPLMFDRQMRKLVGPAFVAALASARSAVSELNKSQLVIEFRALNDGETICWRPAKPSVSKLSNS